MSFSFNVTAKSKDDAKAQVAEQMRAVASSQVSHVKDEAAINATVSSYLDMLDTIDGHTISVSVSGSIGWNEGPDGKKTYTGAGISVSVRSYQSA